jgi:hypothetical protein
MDKGLKFERLRVLSSGHIFMALSSGQVGQLSIPEQLKNTKKIRGFAVSKFSLFQE